VVGTSRFTQQFHLESFKNHSGIELAAICGRNRERAQEVAGRYGIKGVFTDYSQMVRHGDVDAIAIVTPNYLHHPIAMEALSAGKHVFCEKPLAMNLHEAREMYEKAQAAGIVHMVNFTFRGVPAGIRMKQLIDEGYIGKLYHIQIAFMSFNRRGGLYEWRRDAKEAGTGVLGDLGSHVIDQARWFGGEVKRVSGHLSTVEKTLKFADTGKSVPNETDDACSMVMEFENGAEGLLTAFWLAHPGMASMELRVEAHGSDGMLRMHYRRAVNPRSWATLWGAHGTGAKEQTLPLPAYLTEGLDFSSEPEFVRSLATRPYFAAQRFAEALVGSVNPTGTFYDGMRVQAVIDAVAESNRNGCRVNVA
jgi:predicted dehydrogenase